MPDPRLLMAFCPYPTQQSGDSAPLPIDDAQTVVILSRVDNLPEATRTSVRDVMKSVMGKTRTVTSLLYEAVEQLLVINDRTDVQYPQIGGQVYIVSASRAGGNFTTDMIQALDMSGITKEPF